MSLMACAVCGAAHIIAQQLSVHAKSKHGTARQAAYHVRSPVCLVCMFACICVLHPPFSLPDAALRDSPDYGMTMTVLKSPSDGGGNAGDFDTKSMISESHAPPSQSRGAPIQGAWINTMSSQSGAASVSGISRRSAHSAARGKGVGFAFRNDFEHVSEVDRALPLPTAGLKRRTRFARAVALSHERTSCAGERASERASEE